MEGKTIGYDTSFYL